ncbi:MAG: helix-turn-helix domain-containing protein [Acidobacteriaceae bacterium]
MAGIGAALTVAPEDRAKLQRLVRCGKTDRWVAFRSRIVLQAAEGWSNSAIARALGTSRPTVIDWRKRYEAEGVAR